MDNKTKIYNNFMGHSYRGISYKKGQLYAGLLSFMIKQSFYSQ